MMFGNRKMVGHGLMGGAAVLAVLMVAGLIGRGPATAEAKPPEVRVAAETVLQLETLRAELQEPRHRGLGIAHRMASHRCFREAR